MPRFDERTAIAALEVQQLIADWGNALDLSGGLDIPEICTEDCEYLVGGKAFRGHEAIRGFYAARGERVRTQQKDGARTQRHTITNLRVTFPDADTAKTDFILVNYSAPGHAPVRDLVGPTVVADCRIACRRDTDGEWRISLFDSEPVFIGNDPFLNAAVVRQ